ncbi:MAG: DUF3106 domain-containing protein [Porticoccaceae bacterium]|nr:DUF3106 domain-containing protein [Porticoccaceae bacterium]|tara:strand:- start:95 stop:637 length:543 start_codon:yes stop_codon:yes gene_type:complete
MNTSVIMRAKPVAKTALILVMSLTAVLLSPGVIAKPAPVHFDTLSAELQDTLSPMKKDWHRLNPHMQHRIVKRAQNADTEERARLKKQAKRWRSLSPEQHRKLRKARQRFAQLPPHKRKELRHHWKSISAEKRHSLMQYHRRLSPAEDKEVSNKVKDMINKDRQDFVDEVHRQRTQPSEP